MDNDPKDYMIDRRADAPPAVPQPKLYIYAAIAMSVLVMILVLVVVMTQPKEDYPAIISVMLALFGPIITMLFTAAIGRVSQQVDGKSEQQLMLVARLFSAKGQLDAHEKIIEQSTIVTTPPVVVVPANGAFTHARSDDPKPRDPSTS